MATTRRRRRKTTHPPGHVPLRPSANRYSVDVTKRQIIHDLWPELVMHGLIQTEHSLHRMCVPKLYGEGLTEGERVYLNKKRQELHALIESLHPIHYRLKR